MTGAVAPTPDHGRTKVALVGHVAAGRTGADGQVLRTRVVAEELRRRLGPERVRVVDTGGGLPAMARMAYGLLRARLGCSDVVFMPGSRGLRLLLPLYLGWRRRAGIRLHYLVVGGWLPAYLRQRPQDADRLRGCDGIHVQTRRMLGELRTIGLDNVHLLPNFRRFSTDRPRSGACANPLRLVFLSRIVPEKGAALAVEAVERVNAERGGTVATLDVYGPIGAKAGAWFESLMRSAPPSVRYRGVLAPERVHARLADYDVMLFPTYYSGEGFPGAVLDAMIAGIPVIASDWQDNAEFVEHERNGLLFPDRDVGALVERVRWVLDHPSEVMRMKLEAATRADAYHVDAVFPELLACLGWESQPATAPSRAGASDR